MLKLSLELRHIRGINARLLAHINRLGIVTVRDLLWHFPHRYEDFSAVVKIADLAVNQTATVQGVIKDIDVRRTWQRRMVIVEALIADDSGGIKAVWFNQPYITRILQPGRLANFAGKVVYAQDEVCLSNPVYELVSPYQGETKHTAGLIPVYPETRGLTSKGLRYLMKPILNNVERLPDFIPADVLKKFQLPEINLALKLIHFPRRLSDAERCKKRFAFEDLFLLQCNNLILKRILLREKAIALIVDRKALAAVVDTLPFQLTPSQQTALEEILADLQQPHPMNRLLQGDVGSGKTIIAALCAIVAARNGKQSVLMAPTEVLAKQHYRTFMKFFGSLNVAVGVLTGGEARRFYGDQLESEVKKNEFAEAVAAGDIKIIIGTHAVIAKRKSKRLVFPHLIFVIVDEQHRFGVEQRAALLHSQEYLPHFLSMSATPIPRTLTLTLFGDLDLSVITELPAGRKNIITKIVAPANRQRAYQFVREQIQKGRQAFIICPRIEVGNGKLEVGKMEVGGNIKYPISNLQSPISYSNWDDVRAVKEEYEKLSTEVFPDLAVAMLHGKLKGAEKNRIMADFANNKIQALVTTSVIEVGVDVPNATVMIIEGADRFGLAQLYQFRGRVGRDRHQSFCLLFTDSASAATHQRLKSLLEAKNGFELAEKDLAIRGPGEFLGHTQTGLPDLAMRSLNDLELVRQSRLAAADVLHRDFQLKNYPFLRLALSRFKERVHLE